METFPSDKDRVSKRRKTRQKLAKLEKEYTPEEVAKMQEEIPEWKRTAVQTLTEEEIEQRELGAFSKLYRKGKNRISSTQFVQSISQTEEYKEYRKQYHEYKTEAKIFKEDLKEEIDHTQNPTVQKVRSVGDMVFMES